MKVKNNDLSKFKKIGIRTSDPYFKNWHNNGLFENLNADFANEVQKYWNENYDRKVDTGLHMAFMNLTGKEETRLVPRTIMTREVLPVVFCKQKV
ncbi:MAG: hypothetical protein GX963_11585 [Bacteroidales bacterium]|nr:hypothetical protein [Bacteroidales bacterium]